MKTDFAYSLLQWYIKNKRDLPWRHAKDPYKIWVSEIMLAQTTVNTVIEYYKRFIKAFPTIYDLATSPQENILKLWQGLGYYNRAKNMHKAALMMVRDHQGRIPRDPKILRQLPGFGAYTTGAVLSIAYDIPLTIIDANVRRVVMRFCALHTKVDSEQDNKINAFLSEVIPQRGAGDFNQALMELGALVCRNQSPLCGQCPLMKKCLSYRHQKQDTIPQRSKKIIKKIKAVIAIIKKQGRYYIQRRPPYGLLADLWEFPGGKVARRESKENALRRELKEELNVKLESMHYLFEIQHFYTQFKVCLSVFACTIEGQLPLDTTHRWVKYKDFLRYPMPSANQKIIDKILLLSFNKYKI